MIKIKPHHFIDIIKLHGVGLEQFVPDLKMGHDFYKIGNEILQSPDIEIQLTLSADDICQPCIKHQNGKCIDPLTHISKEDYNLRLDQRIIKAFQLSLNQTYTALELCMTYYYQMDKFEACYLEEEADKLSFRRTYFSLGAKKYIEKYAPSLDENMAFRLGVMDAFCEVVSTGVKRLAFSHATNDNKLFRHDLIHAYQIAKKYQVHFYIEHQLIETLLFKNSGQSVLIFYRDEKDIEAYLHLKQCQTDTLEKQLEIAKNLGYLLSYQEERIEAMIQSNLKTLRGAKMN